MTTLRKVLLSLSLAGAVLIPSQATARRTVIDQGEFLPLGNLGPACTIGGAACTATILPFSFDFGTGVTNQVYIYDRGIVSFGAPIPNSADPTGSFVNFGVPVIAPLYVPGASGTPGPYEASSGILEEFAFPETLPNFGTDLFLITFLDPTAVNEEFFLNGVVHLIIDASADELRIEFIHGESNTIDGNVITVLPNVAGTQMGFVVGGQVFFDASPDIVGTNAFSIGLNGAIPEPATWLTMLLGFGAIGFALRRNRERLCAA